MYLLRRSKRRRSVDDTTSSSSSCVVESSIAPPIILTIDDSDDGSCSTPSTPRESDDDGDCICLDDDNKKVDDEQPRIVTSLDGRYQSLSSPLIAKICKATGLSSCKSVASVTLKWELPREYRGYRQSKRIITRNKKADNNDSRCGSSSKQQQIEEDSAPNNAKEVPNKGAVQSEESKKSGDNQSTNNEDTGLNMARKKRSRASPKKPEVVLSSPSKAFGTEDSYDEDDYRSLHERYLMPRVREKVELPGGRTIRRQVKGRVIDQNTQGYRMLRSKVDSLLRKNNHGEVYRLLCQLRSWELDPQRVPAVFLEGHDVVEVIDLSKQDDDTGSSCINVDEFITDVLLVPSHTRAEHL